MKQQVRAVVAKITGEPETLPRVSRSIMYEVVANHGAPLPSVDAAFSYLSRAYAFVIADGSGHANWVGIRHSENKRVIWAVANHTAMDVATALDTHL